MNNRLRIKTWSGLIMGEDFEGFGLILGRGEQHISDQKKVCVVFGVEYLRI